LPYACAYVLEHVRALQLVEVSLFLPFAVSVLASALPAASIARHWTLNLLALTGPICISASFLWLTEVFVLDVNADLSTLRYVALATLLITTVAININFASPRRYYRDRLARAYLHRRDVNRKQDSPLLSEMHKEAKSPYHLICASLNIPASDDAQLLGRGTDFFLFSKHFCGSRTTSYHPTKTWEARDRHIDLATAISISGAAASPIMGTLPYCDRSKRCLRRSTHTKMAQ